MSESGKAAAPLSGGNDNKVDEEPGIEAIMADPEIAPLLEFEPAVRKVKRPDGWTPERQREFVAWLAHDGSPGRAAARMGKNVSGIEAIYRAKGTESFRAAWDAALELAWAREEARGEGLAAFTGRAPGINARGRGRRQEPEGPLPGQRVNEFGEYEDEESFQARAEQAKSDICNKLLRIRRLFLQEISDCPGKRAAFEILTELPVDWTRAKLGKAQDDEPYRNSNQRQKDMVLLAESGWSFGELGYGPDRKARARRALDEYRAAQGLEPIDWEGGNGEEGASDGQ